MLHVRIEVPSEASVAHVRAFYRDMYHWQDWMPDRRTTGRAISRANG